MKMDIRNKLNDAQLDYLNGGIWETFGSIIAIQARKPAAYSTLLPY